MLRLYIEKRLRFDMAVETPRRGVCTLIGLFTNLSRDPGPVPF